MYPNRTENTNTVDKGEIVLYKSQSDSIAIDVFVESETVWLTQAQMVELFGSSKANISEHLKHIFDEGELIRNMVVRKFRTTTRHGAIPGKIQTQRPPYRLLRVYSAMDEYLTPIHSRPT